MAKVDTAARSYVRGKTTFEQFEKATGGLWTYWANRLTFNVPPYLDREDVRQELLIEAFRASQRFDETKGTEPAMWMTQSAINIAKKAVMRARGVNRHEWKWNAPARFDIAVETVNGSEPEWDGQNDSSPIGAGAVASVDATQEEDAMEKDVLRQVFNEHGPKMVIVVRALMASGGSGTQAAKMIWQDRQASLLLRLGSESEATRFVRKQITKFVRRKKSVELNDALNQWASQMERADEHVDG